MNEDELVDGIKRRVAYALAAHNADSTWYADHLRGMQRFVVQWEQRNLVHVAERVYANPLWESESDALTWENET